MRTNGNLLDTNVIVDVLRDAEGAADFLNGLDTIFVPSVVIGELLYGAGKSEKVIQNTEMISKLVEGIDVLPVDRDVAVLYAQIKNDLRKTGYTIPENDVWIAAVAKKNELALVTNDRHFKHIDMLTVVEGTYRNHE
jgi:tRNA(fMet)-specific endonuclease VapC